MSTRSSPGGGAESAASVPVTEMRRLAPFEGLRTDNLRAILERAEVRRVPAGQWLFREGEDDAKSYFLLQGAVALMANNRRVRMLRSDTPEASTELAPVKPRRLAAKVEKTATVLVMESELLEVMLSWDKTGTYEVSDFADDDEDGGTGDDWMTTLLHSSLFQHIPPGNIQAIFLRLERRPVNAGDIIVRQGDFGDYFYFLIEGTAMVKRESPHGPNGGFALARLGKGDTFGEEALISGRERTASVIMQSDGVVMRLGQEDFRQLLCEPMLDYVSYEDGKRMVDNGARWLDVRLPNEVSGVKLENAITMPLFMVRMKFRTLDQEKPLVVACDDGGRAAAAAYLLTERGFKASVVEGGLKSVAAR